MSEDSERPFYTDDGLRIHLANLVSDYLLDSELRDPGVKMEKAEWDWWIKFRDSLMEGLHDG